MNSEWDESYFDAAQEDASIYWVCFWTGDDLQMSAQHDPQRVTAAASVEEVVAWIHQTKGDRRYELFVETHETVQSRSTGWTIQPKLVRLAGDFRPRGTVYTITASSTTVQADPREQR